jgi:pimeloyl-ACP methyl ester carboxylesterase
VLHEMQDRAGPAVVARHIQAMIDRYDSTACLPRIACPTLVIAGRQDPLFPVAEHAFIARSVQNGRLAVVEDAGHAVQRERPQAVTAMTRYWLTYY